MTTYDDLKPVAKLAIRTVNRMRKTVDKWRGLDFLTTTNAAEVGLDPSRVFRSSPSGDIFLWNALHKLRIRKGDTVLDIGCGKGSAIRCMLHFPFSNVDGVELSAEFATVAKENFQRLGSRRTRIFNQDAVVFDAYCKYNFFYFYNPFPAPVMEKVISAIAASRSNESETVVIYNNPTCHYLVAGAGFHKLKTYPDWWGNGISVYSSLPLDETRCFR